MNPNSLKKLPSRALELVLAAVAAAGCICVLTARRGLGRRRAPMAERRLLVLNSHYSLNTLRGRRAEHLVTHRDLDGYFDHVWSVHPLVGAAPGEPPGSLVGRPSTTHLNPRHTMIEGKVRRHRALAGRPYLDFVLAQASLLLTLDRVIRDQGVSMLRGDPYYNGLLALLLGWLHGCPVEVRVIANHDAIYEQVGALAYPRLFRWRRLEQRIARLTLSHADRVVIGTEDYRPYVRSHGARDEQISVIGNWSTINPVHLHEPRQRSPQNEIDVDRPVIVCVARLQTEKYPQDVIASVAKARRTHPDLIGVIVGEGALRGELEQLCAELDVADHVILPGDRDQEWIASMLAQATVVVAPLAGLALVEAALSGTPIVAYDCDWHSEVLQNDDTGILVAYRDTDAMAAAICALLEDPERAEELARRARTRVLEIMDPATLLAQERDQADALQAAGAGRH